MSDFLARMLAVKAQEVRALHARPDAAELRAQALAMAPGRDFLAALRARPGAAIIAEVKKASPSLGDINPTADPAAQARLYAAGGAAACSVLCDASYFKGSLADLAAVRAAVDLPLLAKDFHIDELQLAAARLAGADAALLIAAALSPQRLAALHAEALALGLTPLVEVHAAEELPAALALNPPLIGVNNRNLDTLKVDVQTAARLRPMIPAHVLTVAESGVSGPADVARLRAAGLDAFLVGGALMAAADPLAACAALRQAAEAAR